MKIIKTISNLFRFLRRVIFERGWYVVPPEEEGGYIIPEIWKSERKHYKIIANMIRDEELRNMGVPKWLIGKSRKKKN